METSLSASLRRTAANWWVYLLGGIVMILLGLWAFRYPGNTYLSLSIFFAAAILVNGIAGLVFAVTNRAVVRGWAWLALLGGLEALLGVYLLSSPAIAADTFAFCIGFWLMLRSSITISNAFMMRQLGSSNWGWMLAFGLLGVLISFDVLANPGIGALGASVWVASGIVVLGIAACVLGVRLRQASHALTTA